LARALAQTASFPTPVAASETSSADFYGAYQVARVIVDPGGGSGTPPTPPTPPVTPHP
jgi:hypothetical protein